MKILHAALALALTLTAAFGDDEPTTKKGICLGAKGGDMRAAEKRIESLNVGWHYNWTGNWKGGEMKDVPFVPMIWGDNQWTMDSIDNTKVVKSKTDSSPLLSFNEPDGKEQANMTVERALELWPMLEKTNRRLGSPATVHPDNEWMKSFMKGAEEKGYRVDFICVHWYGENDPRKFISRLEAIHELYKKPIWITEFAVADWSAKSIKDNDHSPQDVLRFMKLVLPKLDRLDFVERYAWFTSTPGHPKLGSSALFDESGNLTELGEFYSNHGK